MLRCSSRCDEGCRGKARWVTKAAAPQADGQLGLRPGAVRNRAYRLKRGTRVLAKGGPMRRWAAAPHEVIGRGKRAAQAKRAECRRSVDRAQLADEAEAALDGQANFRADLVLVGRGTARRTQQTPRVEGMVNTNARQKRTGRADLSRNDFALCQIEAQADEGTLATRKFFFDPEMRPNASYLLRFAV